jgi:membrane-associated phospholipid phosphatase
MTIGLRLILALLVFAPLGVDIGWASYASFDIDRRSYVLVGIAAAALAAGSYFYEHIRKDEKLSAMLFGTFFLISFSASAGVLNYFLMTVAGARIDTQLAEVDQMLGIYWPALMQFAEAHPLANRILFLAYASLLPQTAVLINCLGFISRPNEIYKFCLALALGAGITIAFWTWAPSFGAFSLYPVYATSQFVLAVDANYARDLLDLLSNGPGRISPYEIKGLVAFPSFHTALAVIVTYYAWNIKYLRWIFLVVNSLVVISIPIQGGHHVIDIVGGFAVAFLAIALTSRIARWSLASGEVRRPERPKEPELAPSRAPAR